MKTVNKGNSRGNGQNVTKRLQSELMSMMMEPIDGVSAFPGDNLLKWIATIVGPVGTVYEGLEYKLSIEFSDNYPISAPTVKFITPCFHPNVDTAGNICLDILKENWSPVYNVGTLLNSIRSLLGDPNNSSPLNVTAANLWDDQQHFKTQLLKSYNETKIKSSIINY